MATPPLLSHERLDVYQRSIQFLCLTSKLATGIPRGHGELLDQWKRAAISVPLNIAEASGRTGSLDNARHFSIARGSALECGAIVDACHALGLIEHKMLVEAKNMLVPIVGMLTKLCDKGRGHGQARGP